MDQSGVILFLPCFSQPVGAVFCFLIAEFTIDGVEYTIMDMNGSDAALEDLTQMASELILSAEK